MLLPLPVFVALLLGPIELLEERTLHDGAPATETVTVRGLWPRREGALALLPPPSVTLPRAPSCTSSEVTTRSRSAPRRAGGPRCSPRRGPATRLVATVTRPVDDARMFHLRWPITADLDAPTRRVDHLPVVSSKAPRPRAGPAPTPTSPCATASLATPRPRP
ncbi:MAG: hypothetical protein R3A52_13705 [Polyangiales bacterium]